MVRTRLSKLQKRCTRLAAASDKVYQLLAHGRWFTLASSTTKTGRHNITEILLKVVLNTINQIKSWFSPGPPVSYINKTDRHDITEILLKVALNTIKQTNKNIHFQHTDLFHYLVHSTYANI